MVVNTQKKRPTNTHIVFSKDTMERLLKYLEEKYGPHRGVSLVVDRATREFLDREGY